MLRNIIIVAVILFIGLLFYLEYRRHDRQANSNCLGCSPSPERDEPTPEYLAKVIRQVETGEEIVQWRRALVVALISAFLVIFFVKRSMPRAEGSPGAGQAFRRSLPTAPEYIFAVSIIFILGYFSSHWIATHFTRFNNRAIIASLNTLRDRAMTSRSL